MIEIERKYLIEYPDTALLTSLADCTVCEITQTYLTSDQNETRRVRKSVYKDKTVYTKNTKVKISPISRVEDESEITEDECAGLLLQRDAELNTIIKTRYTFHYLGQKFEVDVYPFWSRSAICENELDSEDTEVVYPDYIRIRREVTQDKRYSNKSMARAIPPEE